jgi:hypothetical protein
LLKAKRGVSGVKNDCVLTVKPLGVVFEGALEGVEASAGGQVVEVGAEDDGVRLGELGVGAAVEGGQVARVALLHPHRGRVVVGVKRALGHPLTHPRHILAPMQVRQVRLKTLRSIFNVGLKKQWGAQNPINIRLTGHYSRL